MSDNTGPRDKRPYMRRLYNYETRCWLHLSGTGETNTITYAWAGSRDQAQTLRSRAKIRGEPFPYKLAPLSPNVESAP